MNASEIITTFFRQHPDAIRETVCGIEQLKFRITAKQAAWLFAQCRREKNYPRPVHGHSFVDGLRIFDEQGRDMASAEVHEMKYGAAMVTVRFPAPPAAPLSPLQELIVQAIAAAQAGDNATHDALLEQARALTAQPA